PLLEARRPGSCRRCRITLQPGEARPHLRRADPEQPSPKLLAEAPAAVSQGSVVRAADGFSPGEPDDGRRPPPAGCPGNCIAAAGRLGERHGSAEFLRDAEVEIADQAVERALDVGLAEIDGAPLRAGQVAEVEGGRNLGVVTPA